MMIRSLVHEWRIARGLSNSQLAEALGIHVETIYKWRNRRAVPSRFTCQCIAKLWARERRLSREEEIEIFETLLDLRDLELTFRRRWRYKPLGIYLS